MGCHPLAQDHTTTGGLGVKIVYLDITTWVDSGIVFGQHYYGKLKADELDWGGHSLERPLSREHARMLNRDSEIRIPGVKDVWHVGDMNSGFFSEDALIQCAKEQYKKIVPDANYLVLDEYGISPARILDGDNQKIIEKANALFKEFDDLKGYDCKKEDREQSDLLANQWRKIMGMER